MEKADSLEQLREPMEDDAAVAELYAAMDVSEVEELLQKVMLWRIWRGVVEDGRVDRAFRRQDMTFEEAVAYFKGRVPVTA